MGVLRVSNYLLYSICVSLNSLSSMYTCVFFITKFKPFLLLYLRFPNLRLIFSERLVGSVLRFTFLLRDTRLSFPCRQGLSLKKEKGVGVSRTQSSSLRHECLIFSVGVLTGEPSYLLRCLYEREPEDHQNLIGPIVHNKRDKDREVDSSLNYILSNRESNFCTTTRQTVFTNIMGENSSLYIKYILLRLYYKREDSGHKKVLTTGPGTN